VPPLPDVSIASDPACPPAPLPAPLASCLVEEHEAPLDASRAASA